MYAICDLEEFARRLMFAFAPFDLQVAREVDVHVYPVDIDFEFIIKTLLHRFGYA
jgi:hypothetical protein